jgi:hypothetical protein
LGVLYVVDSVTRQWVDAARKAGQPAGSAAPDGTFAAGVNRVTELLPVLMTDIINNAPEDQKVRIRTHKISNHTIKGGCSFSCLQTSWSDAMYLHPAIALSAVNFNLQPSPLMIVLGTV